MGTDGIILDITEPAVAAESINSTADVKLIRADGTEIAGAELVGQVQEIR